MENKENYFLKLNAINVNDKTEKKNGLTYLSWAWAWGEVKKLDPFANYKVYETLDGMNYFNDGRTGWVKTGVIVNGIEHIEYLPIMDYKNKSIPLEQITSFDVNKSIQRSLTKAVARHGLGLYIYAGEDLPEDAENIEEEKAKNQVNKQVINKSNNAEKTKVESTTESFMKAIEKEGTAIKEPVVFDNDLPFFEEEKVDTLMQLQDLIAQKCQEINRNPIDCYNYYCKQFKVKSVDELDSTQLMQIANSLDKIIQKRGATND